MGGSGRGADPILAAPYDPDPTTPSGASASHPTLREPTSTYVRGSWSEQVALLFRDYVRADPKVAVRYATLKQELADQYRDDREGYTEAKNPFVWATMAAASDWSQAVGWEPGPSDGWAAGVGYGASRVRLRLIASIQWTWERGEARLAVRASRRTPISMLQNRTRPSSAAGNGETSR